MIMEVKKIKVLRESNNSRLEKRINELLTESWESTDVLTIGVDHDIYMIMKKE